MQPRRPAGDRWLSRVLLTAGLGWAGFSYLRSVGETSPRPALHGAGLAVVVLNVVTVALLGACIGLSRRADRVCKRTGGRDAGTRDARLAVVLAGLALVTALALYGVASRSGGGFTFAMVALWSLVVRLGLAWAVAAGGATLLATAAISEAIRPDGPDLGLLAAGLGVLVGAIATRQRRLAETAARRAEAETIALAERSRMAREIHDILAHSLSAQVVHLEAARLLLARDGDGQALEQVERAGRLARSGLEETRRALAALRGDAPPLDEALESLAADFRGGTGRACPVEVTGTAREVAPPVALAVVRTAQEALTNTRKHAPGADARIALRYTEREIVLDVADTGGTEPPLDLASGGYGLVGMRERAALIGGTLETGPDEKGFTVSLRVPS
ncbi:Sensor histidine kinase DesK [Actinomadura rubteroloni]|uniref:histidine kinase n=1 Tax=Actinomadura rubteroloni TaxID=1926885 RepID=A0A2P4UCD4_9ACTN|nr:sensor histidine kinase [Actinomadura rubteroloni]POM22697.1 Sensor histidine kinase DesK [Actinomadura rubteroloni]